VKKNAASDVVIDFLVPARFASRYRAAVTAICTVEAELRFAFCPRLFGTGVLVSCPATLSLVRGPTVIGSRGILWIGQDSERTTARFQFESPLSLSQVELLRHACQAPVFVPMPLEYKTVAAVH
jgi:hypothetical protein